ncbi:MAG: hypothetical protein GY904_35010 [Planctomycetaceae bacterium]|nr:hypothetical protein [Planctomycetaceae bacterium]
MALHERDREDLLRDGHTMIHRGECDIDGITLLAGFRRQNQLSLYCGVDPVFQFNANGHLRRVYFQGRRFAAQQGQLAELIRASVAGKTHANSNQIDCHLMTAIHKTLEEWIVKVRQQIAQSHTPWRTVGEDSNAFQHRLTQWIECYGSRFIVADSPNA